MNLRIVSSSLYVVALMVGAGCGGSGAQPSAAAGAAGVAGSSTAGGDSTAGDDTTAGGNATVGAGGDDATPGAAGDATLGAGGDATLGGGGDATLGAGGDMTAGGTGAGDYPPIPATVSGHVSVVVRDQGTDTAFDCMGGEGAAAPTYAAGGTTTYFSLLCVSGAAPHVRSFRLTVTAMGVALGMGTHALTSTTTAPVPNLAVSIVDDGEGFSASNFNGDGGVSFAGVLTLDAVGAAAGDTVSGSFVASWSHVPIVTGNLTTAVMARAGSIAVSFSFARS